MTTNVPIKQKSGIGFSHDATDVRDELSKFFSLEFVNRIDYAGLFNPLSPKIVRRIMEERILVMLKTKWQKKGITPEIHPKVVTFLAEKGYNKKWGARNLERTVDELISSPLAKFLTKKKEKDKITIQVEIKDNSIKFSIKKSFF